MKAFGWYPENDGCAWYRIRQPLELLGIPCSNTIPPEVALDGDSVIVAQRAYDPGPSQVLSFRAVNGWPTVYELDDLLWKIDPWNPSIKFFGNTEIKRILKHILNATLIFTSTTDLADEVLNIKADAEIEVLPNFIPQSLLDLGVREGNDRAVIGYPASPSHGRDVLVMQAGLAKTLRRTNASFLCIGTDFLKHLRVDGRAIPGTTDVQEFYTLLDFDILVAPLTESRFNACKSPIKVMEAAARGIPSVATNFGPYAKYIEHGFDGFLCDNDKDWFTYLRLLVNDHDLRAEMGRNAREKVSALTYEQNAFKWAEAIQSIAPPVLR